VLTAGCLTAIGLFPALGCVLVGIDAVRDRRFPLIRAYMLVVFYGLWELLGLLGALIVWVASGVWRGAARHRFLRWNYGLQRLWAGGFAWVGLRLFSMRLHVEEDGDVFNGTPILLLVRHASLADTILATYLVCVQRGLRLRYVMKRELLWDPCLDVVGNRLPNCFVDRKSANTRGEAESIASLADDLGPREGVILWPESTRFSAVKLERARERLKSDGDGRLLEIARGLRCVLPPRLLGTLGLLERNPGMDVVFCAHTGFEHAASFMDIFGGSMIGREIRVRFWGCPAASIPGGEQERSLWIYENWRRVDDFVAEVQGGTVPCRGLKEV
jgi:1-acyl-sn-glycerol-3-phosphate acyltransferase